MNITKHEGKHYKEVARVAKVGEIIRLLVGQVDVEKDDILQIVDAKEWGNKFPRYKDAAGCYLENDEYVVLEPLTVMTDEPHPEIAEGSTFVVVDDRDSAGAVSTGDVVTLTNNDGTKVPHFDSDEKLLLWRRLAPLNIIYKDKPKDCVTAYDRAEGHDYTGIVRSCPSCGQPLPKKRVYTAEQIQEAKDIVAKLTLEMMVGYKIPMFRFCNNSKTECRTMYTGGCYGRFSDDIGIATKSDNDVYNEWIGRMVAICKLTGEKLPKWVLKDGE